MPRPRVVLSLLFALLVTVLTLQPAVLHLEIAHRTAQSAPKPDWLPADKQGFGTSRTRASKVWFTLEGGELSEVYYPRLDTPSFRDLQFAVDGVPERDAAFHRSLLLDPNARSLTYGQISADKHNRWQLIKSYAPSGQPGFAPGQPTFSATPLAWSHAQFIRLAWSIAARHPVEQPSVVACRYVRKCG